MTAIRIEDLDDPRISMYRHLKTHNLTRSRDEFVVEGKSCSTTSCRAGSRPRPC